MDCLTTPGTSTGVHELLEQTKSEGRHEVESENTGTGCDVRSGGTGVTFTQEVLVELAKSGHTQDAQY